MKASRMEAAGVETSQGQLCKLLTACRFWFNTLNARLLPPLGNHSGVLDAPRDSTAVVETFWRRRWGVPEIGRGSHPQPTLCLLASTRVLHKWAPPETFTTAASLLACRSGSTRATRIVSTAPRVGRRLPRGRAVAIFDISLRLKTSANTESAPRSEQRSSLASVFSSSGRRERGQAFLMVIGERGVGGDDRVHLRQDRCQSRPRNHRVELFVRDAGVDAIADAAKARGNAR
jgi:hypothetical protein